MRLFPLYKNKNTGPNSPANYHSPYIQPASILAHFGFDKFKGAYQFQSLPYDYQILNLNQYPGTAISHIMNILLVTSFSRV